MQVGGTACNIGDHIVKKGTLFRASACDCGEQGSDLMIYDEASPKGNSSPHLHTNGEIITFRTFSTSRYPNFWLDWDDDESRANYEGPPKDYYYMPIRVHRKSQLPSGLPHPTGVQIEGLLLEATNKKPGQYIRVGMLSFPSHFDPLARSFHSKTLTEDTYLAFDGDDQYQIEIV